MTKFLGEKSKLLKPIKNLQKFNFLKFNEDLVFTMYVWYVMFVTQL